MGTYSGMAAADSDNVLLSVAYNLLIMLAQLHKLTSLSPQLPPVIRIRPYYQLSLVDTLSMCVYFETLNLILKGSPAYTI